MEKFTTALREIRQMTKTLPATRFYTLAAIAGMVALGYLLKALAVFLASLG